MNDSDLCYISGDDAIKAFKEKKLSPVELIDAVIDRTEHVDTEINAFTYTFFDQAREAAKIAEKKYVNIEETGELEGLPIGV